MHYFSKDGYFCIAPDQRGYGNTKLIDNKKDKISNYSILNLTKDIYCFIKKLGVTKINVVGHDFGSYVASYFSMLYPKFINTLVIMSMPFSGTKNNKNKFSVVFNTTRIQICIFFMRDIFFYQIHCLRDMESFWGNGCR